LARASYPHLGKLVDIELEQVVDLAGVHRRRRRHCGRSLIGGKSSRHDSAVHRLPQGDHRERQEDSRRHDMTTPSASIRLRPLDAVSYVAPFTNGSNRTPSTDPPSRLSTNRPQ